MDDLKRLNKNPFELKRSKTAEKRDLSESLELYKLIYEVQPYWVKNYLRKSTEI